MKTTILLTFLTSIALGQNSLPKHDTIIQNKDGSETKWQVKSHAIYMTTYKNGKWNGPAKAYYENGRLWSEDNRVNDKIEGPLFSYTPNGDTATIEEWRNSSPTKRIIFYQNTTREPQKYFFVSKKGFPLLLNGVQAKFDKTTPDSLVEEGPDYAYIWYKGEKKLLYGQEAPKFVPVTAGAKPGFYKVEGKTQTFFRPFTEGEKKMFMKPATKTERKK